MNIARRMRVAEHLARWEVETRRSFWWENLKKSEYLGNCVVHELMLLKWIVRKYDGSFWP